MTWLSVVEMFAWLGIKSRGTSCSTDGINATVASDTASSLTPQPHFSHNSNACIKTTKRNKITNSTHTLREYSFSKHRKHVSSTIRVWVRFWKLKVLAARRIPDQLERCPPLLLPYRSRQDGYRLWSLQSLWLKERPRLFFFVIWAWFRLRLWFQQAVRANRQVCSSVPAMRAVYGGTFYDSTHSLCTLDFRGNS